VVFIYLFIYLAAASGGGCKRLEVLTLSGCENVSKKGLRSVMRHLHCLRTLTLRGCRKLNDTEGIDHNPRESDFPS
jgi:hypothetical protein